MLPSFYVFKKTKFILQQVVAARVDLRALCWTREYEGNWKERKTMLYTNNTNPFSSHIQVYSRKQFSSQLFGGDSCYDLRCRNACWNTDQLFCLKIRINTTPRRHLSLLTPWPNLTQILPPSNKVPQACTSETSLHPWSLRFPIAALHPCSRRLNSTTTLPLQLIVFFVPSPHFGVASNFLLLPLPRAVDAQPAVGFDDAAEGHAGHLEEATLFSSGLMRKVGGEHMYMYIYIYILEGTWRSRHCDD